MLCRFIDDAKRKKASSTAADSCWNKENTSSSSLSLFLNGINCSAATAVDRPSPTPTPTPKPTPNITTLWVKGFDSSDDEKHIRHLFREFVPIVCVDRPKDKKGNFCSDAYVTLLSKEADDAIEIMNGMREDFSLHVRKAREQRKVAVAVVKKRRRVD